MRKRLFVVLIAILTISRLHSQSSDPVVFTLNGVPTYKSEVLHAYQRSNENTDSKQPFKVFLQSYIELKMNVEEAKALRLDTLSRYREELSAYKSIIAEPYLKDTVSENAYVRKIYDRLTQNIEINHALIPFDKEFILPSDTIAIYKKAIEIRERILKEGFNERIFEAENISQSHQYLGAESKNGYLGWIAPFVLSPQLEDVAYAIPINEISMPIRTANGYHILQVLNKREATGSAEIEQVMFRFLELPASQQQIDSVKTVAEKEYRRIKSEKDFQTLCDAFSEAFKTGDKGCYFGIVGLDSSLNSEFLSATFSLENPGDISEPVISDYGFHIIRLLRKIPVPNYENMKAQLLQKIKSSNRIYYLNKEKRLQTASKIEMTINEEAYSKINDIASVLSPRDPAFMKHIKNEDELLVSLEGKKNIPVKEFARYIKYRQNLLTRDTNDIEMITVTEMSPYNLSTDILKEYFYNFLNILALDYMEYTLEEKYPEIRNTIADFSDGLLLYEVKNRNIWQRSQTDKAGLTDFFSANKNNYHLDTPKYKGVILHAKDAKSLKEAEKIAKKEKTTDKIILAIREKLNSESVHVKIEPGLWIKSDNKHVDYKVYGGENPDADKEFPFVSVVGSVITKPKEYMDVKAEVEADYQKKLEKEWELFLKEKYKVDLNETILDSIQ